MKSTAVRVAAVIVAASLIIYLIYRQTAGHRGNISSATASAIVQEINPEFAAYITSFTSGFISVNSPVRVRFSKPIGAEQPLNTPINTDYFEFEPRIKGICVWKDAETMEFVPDERLKSGAAYRAILHLDKLTQVKSELKKFEFAFSTIVQSAQLQAGDLRSYHNNDFAWYALSGAFTTADYADNAKVENCLTAAIGGKRQPVKWNHDDKGTLHTFVIDSIARPASGSSELLLSCDADPLGVTFSSRTAYPVPARDEFSVLGIKVMAETDPYLVVNFSNPIDVKQSFEGLVALGGIKNLRYVVSANQLFVYTTNTRTGSYTLRTDAGIRDAKGRRLQQDYEYSVVFTEVKPEIRIAGNGNILPSSNGWKFAFETVNLRAVDLKVVKIFENNVLQFLQTNRIDGSNYLTQVGKKVLEKRIVLGINNQADFGTWKRSAIDLSQLVNAEPGAIYRITLSMKKAYSTYSCAGNDLSAALEMEDLQVDGPADDEKNYFGYYYDYESYDYDEDEDYNWSDRDNPCKSYYYHRGSVTRNVLASDIGLTLKKGADGSMLVVSTDLITAKPIGGANIELYDFQKQLIASAASDSKGMAEFKGATKPHFVVARKNKQLAYLRVEEGASLSLSMYDVGGDAVKKGLKGFVYGERGVWRPGDSIYLNFILEDKLATLPENHPVVFELNNPQGQLYKRIVSNSGVKGIYRFACATDLDAPTGFWSATVKIGSVKFQKNVRIETIMPNRLKIKYDLPENSILSATEQKNAAVQVNWLTGAPAGSMPVKVNAALSAMKTEFPGLKNFTFDDRTRNFEAQTIPVFDGTTDQNGAVNVPFRFVIESKPAGMLRAAVTTNVFEPGGAFSVDRFSLTWSPYKRYVGMLLPQGERRTGIVYTNRDHQIIIASTDANGNPVPAKDLKFEMYKLEWRWWWDEYEGELGRYENDDYHRPVRSEKISTVNGKAQLKINIPDNQWGRYLIRISDPESGHSSSTVTFFDWANWMERSGGGESRSFASMLSFNTDKPIYKTGEEVKVMIPTPKDSRALVTIENGSRVLHADWLETGEGNPVYRFKVTPEMAPNVYVHVSLIQPHSHNNDLPIRLYGVTPVMVEDPATRLHPVIAMAETLEPEKHATIVVSEENDREMAFTLAVVDEGLLGLTRFKTPDPFASFYAKEALGISTWDMFDQVIGAYGAELERVMSVGGDGSEVEREGARAKRFKPVVKFFGPYYLKSGEKKQIGFMMPSYLGEVRAMVIAGHRGAYGSAEKYAKVKSPLMIFGTLPRVLAVNEELKLPVTVMAGDKDPGKTEIRVETSGPVEIAGNRSENVNLRRDDEKLVVFGMKVKEKTGIARIKITAGSGGKSISQEFEVEVRNPNPVQTFVSDFTIAGGKTWSGKYAGAGAPGTNSVTLEVSALPPLNLYDRLGYLIRYPHGCIEQTTSQSFAQLHLADVIDLSPEAKLEAEANIRHGIQAISKFQLSTGAMSYWPGMSEPSDWGTSYAGHFLLLAEKKGYALPAAFRKNWSSWQQSVAQNFNINQNTNGGEIEQQAYRLYGLALAGNPATGAMNRLRESPRLTNLSKWLLAGAYGLAGRPDEAERIIAKAAYQPDDYRVSYYTYGSAERDMAVILSVCCAINKKKEATDQLRRVAGVLSSGKWLSTQTTAFAVASVADYVNRFGGSWTMQAKCLVNGKAAPPVKGSVAQVPVELKNNAANISVENNGEAELFGRIINTGRPPLGDEKEANENISVAVVYKDMTGNIIRPAEMTQGSDFMMSVSIRHLGLTGPLKNIALTCNIPSGWEIHNARMDNNEAALKSSQFSYQDFRDDKVMTYFDLQRNESKTFNVLLNATYEGRYYLPAMNAEAMYDNTVFARTRGEWVTVAKNNAPGVASK